MNGSAGTVRVLSLGAGVQSSTIALMMKHGEIEPVEFAVFADTKAEPKRVYDWLDWLEKQLPFPVYRVTQAQGLTADIENCSFGKTTYCAEPPLYTKSPEGKLGTIDRRCTMAFKIAPIRRKIRELCRGRKVIEIIGISHDERQRAKPSRVKYIDHEWPLLDRQMTRSDCKAWLFRHFYSTPPRSACVYCPFKCDVEWRLLRDDDPASFVEACRVDSVMRSSLPVSKKQPVFVHRSCVPLAEVDLTTEEERGQMVFSFDCEGMCGL